MSYHKDSRHSAPHKSYRPMSNEEKAAKEVTKLLYSIFSKDIIEFAALYRQLDDIGYCIKHGLYDPKRGEVTPKSIALAEKMHRHREADEQKWHTDTQENREIFSKGIDEIEKKYHLGFYTGNHRYMSETVWWALGYFFIGERWLSHYR